MLDIEDAIERYKQLYKKDPPLKQSKKMLDKLSEMSGYLCFYDDGLLFIRNDDIQFNYDFDEPKDCFISKRLPDCLHIISHKINDLDRGIAKLYKQINKRKARFV